MKRHVLIAVLLAALMAMGAPASAYNASSSVNLASDAALEVGSQHTTDSDFNTAKSLSGLSIVGTGTDASLTVGGQATVDDFEDGDVAEWSGAMELNQTPNTGSYNGLVNAEGDSSGQSGSLGLPTTSPKLLAAAIRTTDFDAYGTVRYRSGGTKIIEFGFDTSANLYYVDGAGNAVKIQNANTDTYYTVSIRNLDYAADTYDIYVDGSEAVTGVSFINAADSVDEIQPYAGSANGGTTTLIDDIESSDSHGRYLSANHTVENAQQAWQDLELTNATANATLQGWDGTQWVDITTRGVIQTSNQTVSLAGTYSKYRWDTELTKLNHKAISRWSANEGSGTTVNDKVSDNDGEFNETDWSSANVTGGYSVYINSDNNDLLASDDYVTFKQTTNANRSAFGWSAWVRPETNTTHAALLDNWNGTDGIRVHHQTDGSVVFNVTTEDGSYQKIQGGNLKTGAFQLVTVGRTVNGQMFIRTNKTTVASTSATSSPISQSNANIVWGINSNDKDTLTYKGYIDEAGLWGRALTQEETTLLYNEPAAFNESVAKLHDEGIQFQNDIPSINNSAASPNNTTLQDDQATLSIPVNDSQFGTAQGDEVTVEFFINGTSKGTVTMTSNGTAEKTVTGLTGGNKQWHAEIQDSYGDGVTSDTFTFQVPDELRVYNESAPNDLVDETGVTITVRFYESESDTVVTRNTTNGKIDMTGLDPTKQFIIVAKADGYHDRRIIIDSLIEQQEIYMLNKSQNSVHNRFYLDDRTGTFDSEDTKLYIERALKKDWDGDGDNETKFNTISADYFGATGGFPVDLATDQRYRLRLENDAGDTRVLGSYTADAGGDVTLQVGSSTHDLGNKTENYEWEAKYQNESGPELTFKFDDDEDATEDLSLVIYERGNESNEIHNETYAGPLGSLAVSEPLTANQSEKTWVVDWEATRNGNTISGRRIIGQRSGPGIPLSPIWKHTASIGLLIALGGLFGGVRAEMGAIIVSMVAGVLWYIQWLPGAVSGGMVVLALSISILYQQAGGGR